MKEALENASVRAPVFQHDCSTCKYLGGATIEGKRYDYYFCPQGGTIPTILSRFGNDGPDYHSGITERDGEYVALVAPAFGIFLAMEQGHLPHRKVGLLMGIPKIFDHPRAIGLGSSQWILHLDESGCPRSADIQIDWGWTRMFVSTPRI